MTAPDTTAQHGPDRDQGLPEGAAGWVDPDQLTRAQKALLALTGDVARQLAERFEPSSVTLPWRIPSGAPTTVRLLVTDDDGRPMWRNRFNDRVWNPARAAAGVTNPTRQDGTHALRHHYASVLLDAGESIKALSEYLGHHDPGFTLRTYTHLMPASTARTQRAIDGLFGDGPEPAEDGPTTAPEAETGV